MTFRKEIAGHFDLLLGWEHRFEYCEGKWRTSDYNFETPKTDLLTKTNAVVSLEDNKQYEIFDYPGEYTKKDDGEALVRVRMEEDETPYEVVSGTSVCRSFMPGGKFTVTEHISPAESGKKWVLASVSHTAMAADYATSSEVCRKGADTATPSPACPTRRRLRPARTHSPPVIQGSQTAVVVGPQGEEIYTDKYGRIKVQFFWDRYGKKDENSSCWIRCMQLAAGEKWGIMSIPRIGQEVVVVFLEGDPDRPIITGLVYNADQMPAYTLPDDKTKTG